jgi:hypothetical protein
MLQLQGLVGVQVMLAFVLLIGAGLVIKTLIRLQNVGFGPHRSKNQTYPCCPWLAVVVRVVRGSSCVPKGAVSSSIGFPK